MSVKEGGIKLEEHFRSFGTQVKAIITSAGAGAETGFGGWVVSASAAAKGVLRRLA